MSDTAATDRRRLLELMLERRGLAQTAAPGAGLAPRVRPDEIPMSFAQQRLWFLSQLYPASAAYNVTGAIRLTGELDSERLRAALQRIVDRHEALRTGFAGGLQVIAERAELELELVEADDPWPALTEHAERPFDLDVPPLLRCLLVRVSAREHLLGLSVHHVAADGWSLGVLTGELTELYAGREPAPLPLQYADYALWQRDADLEPGVEWWRERLAGAPAVLDLPADRPPPPVQSLDGANHLVELPDVAELARATGTTEFMVLLASLAALLHRLTGEDDVVVGTPVAGRTRPELEPLIGFFVNALPIRVDLSGDLAFTELLARVREDTLAAGEHQDVPFERLVEALGGARDLTVPPVFQVMLAFQNLPAPELDLEGLEIEFLPLPPAGARFPLAVDVTGRQATLNYSTARFDRETIEDLGGRWVRLLESAVADPRARLSRLAIGDPGEPGAVLRGAPAPPAPLVPDAIAAQPADAPALAGMTFGELNARATARAAELGPLSGRLVAVPAERGPGHVIEALAVWRAGGAFTTARDHAPVGQDAAGLAYAIRTSGSTGRPKLVGVGHEALANACAWHARTLGLGPGERAAQTFSLEFDASLLDLWGSLAAGAEVRFAPEDARLDGAQLAEWMRAEAITVGSAPSGLVPGLFAARRPEALRSFFTGGERIAAAVPEGLRLSYDYGPTEAAIVATAAHDLDSIGTPIDSLSAYVLDGDLRPVPPGVTGELHLGGAGVARGYLGMPGMTAERFLPDPWGAPGARMYRTGDLARLRRDGRLEFRGRVDEQLKVRGHRIESGEVEVALRSHAQVREAAVVKSGDRLVAAVVGDASTEALREHLTGRLPAYMVPQVFVALESLPRTATGKLDRPRIATLEPPAPATRGEHPRTATEQALATIWAEVLGRDGFGPDDDFFAVGGHSLLATQVVARVRDRFAIELPLRALFEAPTLARLAATVEQAMRAPSVGAPPPPRPVPRDGPLPLSFSQQRLWFLDQMEPASHAYNLPVAVRLEGPLDRHAVERAVRGLVARHESLRTTFTTIKGEPRQMIAPDAAVPFSVMDLGHVPASEREHQLDQALAEEASRPFDLAAGPLLRCTLIRLAEREHVLSLCMHHVVSDGWSLGILADELSALYDGRPLPPLPLQYPDYAVWQREWLQGEELERQIAHWKATLAGAPLAIELPSDRPRPPVITPNGLTYSWTVPRELAARIDALAAAEGATPFMVLLAAWAALLQRMTGQDDIVVGTPIANRRYSETEGLIGFFVNTLVLRTDLAGDPTFAELVGRVRGASLDAYAHQDLPFEKLVDAMSPPRDLSLTPIFQVGFAVQNASDPHFRFGEAQAEFEEVAATAAKFDLSLDVFDSGDGHVTSINYRTDLFDPETIQALADRWEAVLRSIVEAPGRRIADLDVLGAGERERLLGQFAGTNAPYEADALMHEAFERHADAAPDVVALVFEGHTMTYGELEVAANRVANELRGRGVRPEDRVGLLVGRGFELIVGLLGILKSGAAYVPVDTSYPDVRVDFTLRDAGVRLAVTDMPERLPDGIHAVAPAEGRDASRPPRVATPRSLAYVIYTSGSTGVPKGVGVEHRSVLNLVAALRRSFAPGPEDRVLQFPSIAFDAAVWDVVMALANGAALVLASRASLLPGRDLLRTLADERVTIVLLPPTAAAALPPGELPHLRLLLIGGEALTDTLAQRWAKVTRTVNAYGPTEATVACTWHDIEFTGRAGLSSPPIGRPIANAPALVLDRHGNPVPVGVAGELHVGGVAVARGYLGRAGLTAERFVPDPWGEPGSRLYRTGDLVRFTRDGELEFLGRVDRQVKLRGFRIELGEIETAVQTHPDVADAVAIVREDQPGDRRVVVYVVARGDATPTIADLRTHIGGQLPDHMMPSAFVLLEALPLTSNHKVDRGALPAPTAERPELEAAFTPARDERERTLAAIWADVLGLDRVGIFDNFFDLGGDSILAIQVVSRVNDAGINIAAKHLFQAQTIYDLGLLDSARAFLEPDQGLITGPLPLTPIQRWFLEQEQPDPHHFNQAVVLEGDRDIDAELLERTLGHLTWQHDALRLRVARGADGDFHQRIIEPDGARILEVVDGPLAPHAARVQASLDFEAGPVFRAAWSPRDGHLLLVAHHLCVDAVSWPILIEDLNDVYEQLAAGATTPDLPPKSTSLRWWANRLAEHARTGVLRAELDRWLSAVPADVAPLPRDGDGVNTVAMSRSLTSFVGVDATRALTAHGVFDALVYAIGAAVAEWAGDDRGALLALEAHGREEIFEGANLFATVGWFTNVYPLWVPREGGPEAARAARAAVPANGFGYGLLRHMTDAGKRLAALPQPEIALNYLGRIEGGFTGGARFAPTFGDPGPTMSPRTMRPFPLDVSAEVVSNGLQLQWNYGTALHEEATIVSLATRVTTLLEELAR
jgi:amino acid adenylation domain-containing protein/non-ribosomal peptide synthase protein (TIGR01720 family)